jgi:hypothetical protein
LSSISCQKDDSNHAVTFYAAEDYQTVAGETTRSWLENTVSAVSNGWQRREKSTILENPMESVHILNSRFEADLLMDALEREAIPALLRTFEETPYDGLFVVQRGWGQILVPKAHVEAARDIIEPLVQDLNRKKLFDDPGDVDPILWEELRSSDPQAVCRNAQVRYDAEGRAYLVAFLEGLYRCLPEEERIEPLEPTNHVRIDFQFYLVMLHYLLEAQSQGITGKWVSANEVPGGSLFFRGPHAFNTKPLEKLFGEHPELFTSAAEKLGGMRVASGDLAYRFWALPCIPLLFVFWKGDDEFPAVLHIRFDSSVAEHLQSLDTIWALVNTICRALLRIAKDAAEGTSR